jgi:hypothetical protein
MKKVLKIVAPLAVLACLLPWHELTVFAQNTAQTVYAARIAVSDTQKHTVPVVASDTFTLNAATQTLTNKTLTGNTAASFANTGTVTLFTASDTVVGKATTDTLTNKTLDAEGTGNLLTVPLLYRFVTANCNNATAATTWSLPAANAAVATCAAGTNTNFGTLNYPDGANTITAQVLLPVPADFTGNLDARLAWFANATTGAAKWDVSTICVSTGTIDPAFNAVSTVTTTTSGTANNQNMTSFTSITITGCSSSTQTMFLKVARDSNNAGDTLTVDARLTWAEFKLRRAI